MTALLSTLGQGNIPAYAGKAAYMKFKINHTKKHPRIRGES